MTTQRDIFGALGTWRYRRPTGPRPRRAPAPKQAPRRKAAKQPLTEQPREIWPKIRPSVRRSADGVEILMRHREARFRALKRPFWKLQARRIPPEIYWERWEEFREGLRLGHRSGVPMFNYSKTGKPLDEATDEAIRRGLLPPESTEGDFLVFYLANGNGHDAPAESYQEQDTNYTPPCAHCRTRPGVYGVGLTEPRLCRECYIEYTETLLRGFAFIEEEEEPCERP